MLHNELDQRARAVLVANDRGEYTVPNGNVYPFQWNWDSAFVSLGLAALDIDRAWRELESLVRAQWEDGFLPHIIFWKNDERYFPGPEVWNTKTAPPTSGITQPPIAASALRALWERSDPLLYRSRLEQLFFSLLRWHRWFARVRDPEEQGIAVVVHPWESGRDNSPEWDTPSQAIDTSQVGPYQRRDTQTLDHNIRPTQLDYDRYLALVQFGRSIGWDHRRIGLESPFRVADVGTTMILLRANRDLLALAQVLGLTKEAKELARQIRRAEEGVTGLWDEKAGAYCSKDLVTGLSSGIVTSASFLSFYAGLVDKRRDQRSLVHFKRISERVRYLMPSLDPDDPRFEPVRYWRGPVWAVVNFLIGDGLLAAGHDDWAARIRKDTQELIAQHGMYEYFSPVTGQGVGGDDFSWTAAMWLHWARHSSAKS